MEKNYFALQVNFSPVSGEKYFLKEVFRDEFGEFPERHENYKIIEANNKKKINFLEEDFQKKTNAKLIDGGYSDAKRYLIDDTRNRIDVFADELWIKVDLLSINFCFFEAIFDIVKKDDLALVDADTGWVLWQEKSAFLTSLVASIKFSNYYDKDNKDFAEIHELELMQKYGLKDSYG